MRHAFRIAESAWPQIYLQMRNFQGSEARPRPRRKNEHEEKFNDVKTTCTAIGKVVK